jgi:hypothetical protein
MSGFELVPLGDSDRTGGDWTLDPIEPETPSKLKQVALNNPATAIGETALNLGTMGVALPVAGLAGLATEAGRAMGLTKKTGAEVVHDVAGAMTYQPRGEMGQAATQALMYPFEKLAEAGQGAGEWVLEKTDSPLAATVVDTAINAAPMAVVPALKAGRSAAARGLLEHHQNPSPEVLQRLLRMPEDQAVATYEAWQASKAGENNGAMAARSNTAGVAGHDSSLHGEASQVVSDLWGPRDTGMPAMADQLRDVPERRWPETVAGQGDLAGAAGHQWELRARERGLGEAAAPDRAPEALSQDSIRRGNPDDPRGQSNLAGRGYDATPSLAEKGLDGTGSNQAGVPSREIIRAQRDGIDASGVGEGAWDHSQVLAHENRGRRPATVHAGTEAGAAADSLTRAERILNERGSIAGWIDHYNRHVRDGNTVESFSSHPDGSHTLRVTNGQAARNVTIPADKLPEYLAALRDPAKVAEIESRNASDVVLGKRVRDLDDGALERMRGMVSLSDTARMKLEREAGRREVSKLAVSSEVSKETAPLAMRVDEAAHQAATSPLNNKPQPTPAQIEAGTYAKGHIDLHGLPISIENPKGSIRRGTDANGRQWETKLENHYGYFKRSQARDGDHVDVFIGDRPESTKAFVIDQIDPKSGKYDEPKVILGAIDEADAARIYHANYEPGWRGMGAITPMEIDALKGWIGSPDSKRPVALPKIAGKAITEFDDAALARIANSPAYGETAKVKAQAEIQRRTASADFSAESPEVLNSWAPGANYVPLVDQYRPAVSKAASVADLPAPKRREHIISEFASAIGTTVYEGRIKGEKKLGYFRPKIEEVRTKRANDLEVAGHEVAHLIDFRVPELKKAWSTDKALATELKSVSYDQKNVREGWAEGMRLWLSQPETLGAKAPRVHAFIEDFANSHQYGPALRKAQEQMTGWFGQDALNRARSKIGTETPLREYMDRFWDKFRQATVDDLHGIYQMERSMLGKIAANGPYESARTSRAAASIADGAVRFGYPVKNADSSFKFAGKGLEEILQPVSKSIDDALLYFVGRSANELMGQGREHLFTKGEIDAMLKLKTPERAKAFEEYQAWNKGVLDFAEAQGVINPEARALWQRTQYLPFHRVEQPGGIKGKPGDWAGIQALTGGTTNIKDVLGNMIGNAAMLIDRSVKNEARRKVAKLAQMEGGGKFMVKIEPGEKMIKVAGSEVIEAILKKTGIALDGDAPAFFEFLVHGQPPAGTNVVAVLQGGKPIWFEVGDPILYRALKAIDRPLMNQVTKVLGWPKRIGQASITTTPEFWLANIARDTLMGSVMSRAGFRPVIDSLKGMASRMTSDPAYRDFIANGSGLSSIFLDETHLKTKLEKYYRDQGIDYRTVLDTPDKLLTMVETLGDAFEMSTRLGEYKRATAAGENPRHAAYLGREVSTDFAMRGDSKALGFMYDTVMFLKPAVLSWDRLYRGVAHDANKGAIAAKAGMMAMFSAGLYLLNRDDPRYADLPDWDRDANWHFFIGDQHFRWPKIWEIGALSSAAERSVEKIIAADPQGLGKDFARILGATFNLNLMPQILAPLYEQGANRNSFTKSPIETPGMEGVQPFLRAKPGTSETMKAAGMATKDNPEWAQVNPVRAEALLRGYFNTWAMYGLMLTDQALYGDKLPEKRTDELPVVRRFYANEPAKHTKYESEFYDLLSEAKRLRGTLRKLDDLGYRSYADAKEQSPLAGKAKPLERAAKNLGAINNKMQAIRRDGNLTPKEKRTKLDELTIKRNALIKGAVTESKAAQKEKQQ